MIREFEFHSAGRVVFGSGALLLAPGIARSFGTRIFLVTGRSAFEPRWAPTGPMADEAPDRPPAWGEGALQIPRGRALSEASPDSSFGTLARGLADAGVTVTPLLLHGEPTVDVANEGTRRALAAACDAVLGLGGGSVLDAAKAISALMTNGGDALDYLEIAGGGRTLETPAAPFVAIPTTAGTGSEVTKNAVLTEPRARVKASIRSALMLPSVALVDPDLTLSLPPSLTASTGLDALTQLIEAFLTPRASPVTDLFALDGIARSARSLLRAVRDGTDRGAREDLALASLFGGLALANAGLGAVHGIAAPLGGRHPVPHGVACARLLPHVFEANLRLLRTEAPGSNALDRMRRIGELLLAGPDVASGGVVSHDSDVDDPAEAAVAILRDTVDACTLPRLSAFGVTPADIPPIVEGALRATSMKGNPVLLSADRLASIVAAAL